MSENMKLWEQVKTTDPAAVKPITGKQYSGNSPKPYWLIQRATEVFGPVGIGWGVTVKSERFVNLGDTDTLHVAVVSVWYVWEGVRSETFEQMGGTKAAYMTSKGKFIVDEDAGKKSVTDGMVKCLSMIGFAGDIFSGQWDDSKYVEWAGEQFKQAPATRVQDGGSVKHSPRDLEEFDQLTAEDKTYLGDLARWAAEAVGEGRAPEVYARIMADKLDDTQYTYLFNQLASDVRAAIKKEGKE